MLFVGFTIMISRETCSLQDIRQEVVGEKGTKMCSYCLAAAISSIHHVISKSMHLPHIAESCEAILVHTSLSVYRIIANEMCVVITSVKTRVD